MRVYTTDRYYMRGRGGLYAADPDAYIRGRGIASIFGRIFSSVVPFVKGALNIGSKVAKSEVGRSLGRELKRSATQAGLNVVSDALKGKNVIESSKKALAQASTNVGNKLDELTNPTSSAPPAATSRSQPRARSRSRPRKKAKKVSFTARRGGGRRRKTKMKKKKRMGKGIRSNIGGGGRKKSQCGRTSKKKKTRRGRQKLSTLFD
jgi:hypothetical protein